MKAGNVYFASVDIRAANFNAVSFVKQAQKYEDVSIQIMRIDKGEEKANAKSLLGVLRLSLEDKDVRITVSGQNCSRNDEVVNELKQLIA